MVSQKNGFTKCRLFTSQKTNVQTDYQGGGGVKPIFLISMIIV